VSTSPLGSLEPEPLKLTVSGAEPLVGVALATAVGGWFTLEVYLMRRIVPPSKSA
jgi:hypothetical protein